MSRAGAETQVWGTWLNRTCVGDCREWLREIAAWGPRAQMCVTSPPYFGLRDYGVAGQIGLESTLDEYVQQLVHVFRLVRNVLADDGTLWLNLGDSYTSSGRGGNPTEATSGLRGGQESQRASMVRRSRTLPAGLKEKEMMGTPWGVAFALQADGWYLRSDIIWHKPNAMPESVTDRPTKAHEYLFLFAKSQRYYYDGEAIKEPAITDDVRPPNGSPAADVLNPKTSQARRVEISARRKALRSSLESRHRSPVVGGQSLQVTPDGRCNRRTVWSVPTQPFAGAHFATFPRALIEPCILAGSRPGDIVLDAFMGSGTTAQVATDLGRQFIGCELNPRYVDLHELRRTTIGLPL